MSPFLDSELRPAEREPQNARFHVVPMPLEKTVSYGCGTAKGPAAILAASNELERWDGRGEPIAAGIHTQPAVDCGREIESALADLAARCTEIARQGAIPVVLGGEHSLSHASVRGTAAAFAEAVGIVQIDAHADLRVDYQGHRHSHASVMHLLTGEGFRLAQYGVRALCREEHEARLARGVSFVDAEALSLADDLPALPEDFPQKLFISFDVDGLDPAVMPATGTPVPGGLGYLQSLQLLERLCQGRTVVGFDVVELAPIAGSPAWDFTAASLVYRLMGLCLRSSDPKA